MYYFGLKDNFFKSNRILNFNNTSICEFTFKNPIKLNKLHLLFKTINDEKYDFDNMSDEDLITLIEDKIQKEKDKIVHNWEEEGIRVEKARWGRHNVLKGKVKVELAKTVDVSEMSLDEAKAIIEANTPKKKAAKKKAPAKKK